MANRGWRYDPLRALESQEELSELQEDTPAQPLPENHNVPMLKRRRLQKMLMASVALNAVLLMTCAWQYLRIHKSLLPAQSSPSQL